MSKVKEIKQECQEKEKREWGTGKGDWDITGGEFQLAGIYF